MSACWVCGKECPPGKDYCGCALYPLAIQRRNEEEAERKALGEHLAREIADEVADHLGLAKGMELRPAPRAWPKVEGEPQ